VGLPDFSTAKLQDALNLPIPNGKTNRPVQATLSRNLTAREVGSRTYVGDPNRFLAGPNTSRHPDVRCERAPPCDVFKGRNLNPRSRPDFDTPQQVVFRVHQPNRADVPIKAFTEGLNDSQGGIVEGLGYRQDAADPMLGSQPPLGLLALAQLFQQALL